MTQEIKPIQIVPFSGNEKKALVKNADSTTKGYDIRFNLSAQPSPKWVEFFQSAWYQEYGGNAVPRFNGNTVQVTCVLENLQNVLDALKFVASTANGRFKAIIEQKVREEAEE